MCGLRAGMCKFFSFFFVHLGQMRNVFGFGDNQRFWHLRQVQFVSMIAPEEKVPVIHDWQHVV